MNAKERAAQDFNKLYGMPSWSKVQENYWDKLTRIARSPHNRIFRTDHESKHKTNYVIGLLTNEGEQIFLPIVAETMSMMEIVR